MFLFLVGPWGYQIRPPAARSARPRDSGARWPYPGVGGRLSEWFLTRLGAGTIGPLATDSVLEGIADGRVPADTTARAVGERDARALLEIPVFQAAVRVARPLGPPPVPFDGLVEAEHDRQSQLRAERAQQRRLETGARLDRMIAPLRQRYAAWLVAIGALLGAAIGVAFTALALPGERAEILGHTQAGGTIQRAAIRVATRALAAPAPASSPAPVVAPPPAAPPEPIVPPLPVAPIKPPDAAPARAARDASPAPPQQSFSIDPLNAPLTPPLGPPRTP